LVISGEKIKKKFARENFSETLGRKIKLMRKDFLGESFNPMSYFVWFLGMLEEES